VLYDDRLFWVDEGEPFRGSEETGTVLSVPRHGGRVTTYAESLPWPQALALDGQHIFWSGSRHSGIWSVPLVGGCISSVVSTRFGCCGITWMHRTERGLLLLQGDWMRNSGLQELLLASISDR
jgi:hypothetical protein